MKPHIKRVRSSELELTEKVVAINRVAKVNQGGRTFSFGAIVVVGDGNGVVGFGLGKAREVTEAINKGVNDGKKSLIRIPLINNTLAHEIETKFSGAKVLMKPAAPGTGIKAGGPMRAVLESAGVKDVVAKSKGSSNPHNVVKATIQGLTEVRDPITVAKTRDVSLERVFNG